MDKKLELKVLIAYKLDGTAVSQCLYAGPSKRHAAKAYTAAVALGQAGRLRDCKIRYFDGYKLRSDWEVSCDQQLADKGAEQRRNLRILMHEDERKPA